MSRPKRTTAIQLSAMFAAIVAAAAAGGCSEPEPDHAAICVDKETAERVDDGRCDENDGRVAWFYYPYSYGSPAVGSKVDIRSGSYVRPTTGRTSTVVPAGIGGSQYGGAGGTGAGS